MKKLCLVVGAAMAAGLLSSCESPKPAACPHCAASGGKGKVCAAPQAEEEKPAGPVQPGGVYLVW